MRSRCVLGLLTVAALAGCSANRGSSYAELVGEAPPLATQPTAPVSPYADRHGPGVVYEPRGTRVVLARETGRLLDAGSQGSASDVVFAAPDLRANAGDAHLSRLDSTLAIRDEGTAFDVDAWPSPNRPSLDRARRVHLNTRTPDSVLFFQPRGEYRRDWDRWHY